jgi:putative transposase
MRVGRDYQPLSYDIRLPDSVQADALRLLDASRAVGSCKRNHQLEIP